MKRAKHTRLPPSSDDPELNSTELNHHRINPPTKPTPQDVEFAFEKKHLPNVINDIKSLIAKDLRGIPGWGSYMRCLTPGYYVFRFGKTAESNVGMAANLKEPVYVQVGAAGFCCVCC